MRPPISMFLVILFTLLGVAVGYLLRYRPVLRHVSVTINLTICVMLFILGLSVGRDQTIVHHLWRYGGQALLIGAAGLTGSCLAAWGLYRYVYKKGVGEQA